MRAKTWLAFLILGLAVSFIYPFLAGSFDNNYQKNVLTFQVNKYCREQKIKSRIFKNVDVKRIFRTSDSLFSPIKLKLDKRNSYLYVLDIGDLRIKKFSLFGKFIRSYGRGKGKGPGEFLNPVSFVVDDNLRIWVSDPYTGIITVIGDDNSIKRSFRPKNISAEICLAKGKVVLSRTINTEYLFDVYDMSGNYLYSLGEKIFPVNSKSPEFLFGFPLIAGIEDIDFDHKFLYCTFERLNCFLAIDIEKGTLKYLMKTIDDIKLPEIKVIETKSGPIYKVGEDKEFPSLAMNLVGDKIYITSGKNFSVDDNTTFVDVYSSESGEYLYSFKIPEKFKQGGYFDGRYYYGVGDTSISKWEVIFR